SVLAGIGDEVGEIGHGAILAHDLADYPRRVEPCETRDIHCRFGMPGAHQHPAIARAEREDVARADDILTRVARIDRHTDCASTISGRNAGSDAMLRLDRDGEGG